ncbi:MAG: hypothetical protein ACD_44C00405G0001 [uncultured bacterium]|nr:MAG: hypothetical protein ACD_44C00405G0001 [uncultured bacterium]OGT68220.1 MAG: branched-chain-amino-acid transaminase [Gammaproteobacteria bacterium RIFCSPLOWO2_02_FULL_38_11]
MQETESIWFNGKLVGWQDAKIHVLTHTLHYGGGAWEGIRFYKTDKGPAIFRLSDHVARLFYSAGVLKMPVPYSKEEITQAIIDVVRVNKLEEGYIRPIAFYGYTNMGVNPRGNPIQLAIACWPWGTYLKHKIVNIKTSKYIRIHPGSTVIDAKLSGHYLNGILASLELEGTSYDEALFLDSHGKISEGAGENFFFVKNNILSTPPRGTMLPGITRNTATQIADYLKIEFTEKELNLEEAYQVDEAFFTGTAAEITPIRSIDDHLIGQGEEGVITAKIKKTFLDIVHGRNTDFIKFLTFI